MFTRDQAAYKAGEITEHFHAGDEVGGQLAIDLLDDNEVRAVARVLAERLASEMTVPEGDT